MAGFAFVGRRTATNLPLDYRGSKTTKRFPTLAGFSFGSVFLLAPVAVTAKNTHNDKQYYDQQGKDYHVYNSQEDRAYRVYLGEQHQSYREFRKIEPAQQQQYFKWRHEHPDNVLFKVQVR